MFMTPLHCVPMLTFLVDPEMELPGHRMCTFSVLGDVGKLLSMVIEVPSYTLTSSK